jgi:DNA repair exonuclease SbcCD ATPase subunit
VTEAERLKEAAQAHLRQPHEHIHVAKAILEDLVQKMQADIPAGDHAAHLSLIFTKGAFKYLESWAYGFEVAGLDEANGAKAIADWRNELHNALKAACLTPEEAIGKKIRAIIEMLGKSHHRVAEVDAECARYAARVRHLEAETERLRKAGGATDPEGDFYAQQIKRERVYAEQAHETKHQVMIELEEAKRNIAHLEARIAKIKDSYGWCDECDQPEDCCDCCQDCGKTDEDCTCGDPCEACGCDFEDCECEPERPCPDCDEMAPCACEREADAAQGRLFEEAHS